MSYKNILGRFGHRWIGDFDRTMILKEFPESDYSVEVTFTDGKSDMLLKDCTGRETNVDAIMIYYKDGTNRRDTDPFRWQVTGPIGWNEFLHSTVGDSNPLTYFFTRCKDRKLFPQTRNEPVEDINAIRRDVREKFVHFLHMDGIDEKKGNKKDVSVLRVPVNCFSGPARNNLIRFLETLDKDGIQTFVTVHFERSTIDQLTRLDTEMEFGDLGEVLAIAEDSNSNDFIGG